MMLQDSKTIHGWLHSFFIANGNGRSCAFFDSCAFALIRGPNDLNQRSSEQISGKKDFVSRAHLLFEFDSHNYPITKLPNYPILSSSRNVKYKVAPPFTLLLAQTLPPWR